jgi:hypothetical protein
MSLLARNAGPSLLEEARQEALSVARGVKGVTRVEDHLRVANPSEPMRTLSP